MSEQPNKPQLTRRPPMLFASLLATVTLMMQQAHDARGKPLRDHLSRGRCIEANSALQKAKERKRRRARNRVAAESRRRNRKL